MEQSTDKQRLMEFMKEWDACREATDWVNYRGDEVTFSDVWAGCHRGDWMLWLWARSVYAMDYLEEMREVVYRDLNRERMLLVGMLDALGAPHNLREHLICDGESALKFARTARELSESVYDIEGPQVFRKTLDSVSTELQRADRAAVHSTDGHPFMVTVGIICAARWSAEDCRELLPVPTID